MSKLRITVELTEAEATALRDAMEPLTQYGREKSKWAAGKVRRALREAVDPPTYLTRSDELDADADESEVPCVEA